MPYDQLKDLLTFDLPTDEINDIQTLLELKKELRPNDTRRICSWKRYGKKHYGYFHLFGSKEKRDPRTGKNITEILALIEETNGSVVWMDPTKIKFED